MLYITNECLQPGMILAKDIYLYNNDNIISVLLTKGQVLTNKYIEKINYHNISGIYIENKDFDDITTEPFIEKTLEAKALTEIKDTYNRFKSANGEINRESIKQISKIVECLITKILSNKNLSYNILEFKNHDDYTYQHCLNVAIMSIFTGISLGLSESMLQELGTAGLLHDLGKMLIPLDILNKPGKLTDEEFSIMKTHPVNAVTQLEHMVSYDILRGIECHHEKLDGTGYPYGRKGDNIHFYGKILTVCDVYDALTTDRPYRKACFPNEVVEYIMGCVDTQFDYEVLTCFLKNIVAYPPGSLVKLSNGQLGVVVKNFSENIMRPVVRIVNEDKSIGKDINLLYDTDYMNVTIVDMGYGNANKLF